MTEPRTASLVTPAGLVSIESAPDPPPKARRRDEADHVFLADAWTGLLGAAWTGFEAHGAGAVVLWRATPPRRWRSRPFEPERLWYATQVHSIPGSTRADFSGWEAELIETYDPRRDALEVFSEGARVRGYRLTAPLAPPEARIFSASRLN